MARERPATKKEIARLLDRMCRDVQLIMIQAGLNDSPLVYELHLDLLPFPQESSTAEGADSPTSEVDNSETD